MRQYIYHIILFLFIFTSGIHIAHSQRKGKVTVIADTKVDALVEKHIEFNKKKKTIQGYRILIASLSGNNSKSSAFRIRDTFLQEYPDVGAYIVFEEPNFKVKVGDYKNRLEAFAFYQQIKGNYPCTIIQDNVFFSKIEEPKDLIEETEFEEK